MKTVNKKYDRLASSSEIEHIHLTGINILETIGVKIEEPKISALLLKSGCTQNGDRIKIPKPLIEEKVSMAPSGITLYGRDGSPSCRIADGNTLVQPVGEAPFFVDPKTGEQRFSNLDDLTDLVRLVDKLDGINFITLPTTPEGSASLASALNNFSTLISYSNKPVMTPGLNSSAEVAWYARIAEIACPSFNIVKKPTMVVSILPSSPLTISKGTARALSAAARIGLPISMVPLPVMGLSAPFNLAGALAQQHAENLAGVIIAQIINQGNPVIYHCRISIGDMRTGNSLWGPAQVGLAGATASALGNLCGVPTSIYGFSTSSKMLDVQSGLERAGNVILPLISGANILGGAGSLNNLKAVSPIQLVIDDEYIKLLKHIPKIPCQVDSQILDAIDSVSNRIDGTFMDEMHTIETLRSEGQWLGRLSIGNDSAKKDNSMYALAKDRMLDILNKSDNGPLLSDQSIKDIESIIKSV